MTASKLAVIDKGSVRYNFKANKMYESLFHVTTTELYQRVVFREAYYFIKLRKLGFCLEVLSPSDDCGGIVVSGAKARLESLGISN